MELDSELIKNIAMAGGFVLTGLAGILGGGTAVIRLVERKSLYDKLKTLYNEGKMKDKPTFFNVYKITK